VEHVLDSHQAQHLNLQLLWRHPGRLLQVLALGQQLQRDWLHVHHLVWLHAWICDGKHGEGWILCGENFFSARCSH
jgi:hypothetical protein